MAVNQDNCISMFKKVLWILVSNGKPHHNKFDGILQQFFNVFVDAFLPNKEAFMQFDTFDAGQRVDNLCQEVFIAQRIVHDHIISVGVLMCVDILKALMTSCQASCCHSRYKAFSDEEKHERLSEAEFLKWKRILMKLDNLRAKKEHMQADIVELEKCTNDFTTDAENKRDFTLIAKSNVLQGSANKKHEELKEMVHHIDIK